MAEENSYQVWLGPDEFDVTASDIDEAVQKAREKNKKSGGTWGSQEVSGVYVLNGPEDDYVRHEDPERFEDE